MRQHARPRRRAQRRRVTRALVSAGFHNMRIRIQTVVTVISLFLLLGGCNSEKNHAFLSHVYNCNGTEDYYSLSIFKPTNELFLSMEMELSYNTLNYYFILDTVPKGQTIYPVANLKPKQGNTAIPELVSGVILVDLTKREADVSLKTRKGDFIGNGKYPFTCTPSCERFHEPCDCSEYMKQHGQSN